ncbi:MAG TPA: imidazole glycerol phosphate synthase subunit HisH [Syntrophorhabdales bacterium]|nr:imidazole glycerol phosphate synthase subunit HisH [Syntrophorhabdales bacterium]
MIAIVDYGMGNLRSVTNAFARLGASIVVTSDRNAIATARAIVLPGVGAFGKCMENLVRFDLLDVLLDQINKGKPYLGICLGLQMLFESSEEAPGVKGLGLVKGSVKRFKNELKVPHMGWNQVEQTKGSQLFKGIRQGEHFYFVHSFYPEPTEEELIASTTDYGKPFASSVERENIFACQFHPEKSQRVGLHLLQNFIDLCEQN